MEIVNPLDSIHSRKNNAYGGSGDPGEDFPKVNPRDVFAALPHVHEIWIVEVGRYKIEHFYLDSSKGGIRITREEAMKTISTKK